VLNIIPREKHITFICGNRVTTKKSVIFQEKILKVFEELLFCMSATTTQLLSSGEFCKLRYDTIPVNP